MDESGSPIRTGCFLCGRPTYDPGKRDRPWSRGVSEGRQVLVCPVCQVDRPGWMEQLDRCGQCDSTRLSLMLGSKVCRLCGFAEAPEEEGADPGSGSVGMSGA